MQDGNGEWRKPLRSYGNGNCVRVTCVRNWRRSSGEGGSADSADSVVVVRDTGGERAMLMFPSGVWKDFLSSLR